ncbi:MAG: radical SAM protein [Candidatus Micrarchaeia archaeon]
MAERLDLKVGFSCNNNCRFCVQGNKKTLGDKSSSQIKKELRETVDEGINQVVFTGGEPTIRKDIIELVSYAHDLGYELIQIQTNGRMLYYKDFCERLIKAGANEFSPAIHGHIAELHDYLTRSPGSFNQTVQGIKNLKELNQRVITNSVVTKPNYRHLPELATLLVQLDVDQFQMAFVHAGGNAYTYFDQIVPRKCLAAPYIKRALQIGINAGIRVMAEAVPYCFMQGYERYVSELYIPPTKVIDFASTDPRFEETRVSEGKCKTDKCKRCKYYLICEGPWREYPERRGWEEFNPVPGRKIKRVRQLSEVT